MFTLKQKVAIITGGAKGIGKSICKTLGLAGATVIIADIDDENGEVTCEQLHHDGVQCNFIKTDITKSQEVSTLVDEVLGKYGQIDILVNNAGILQDGFITDITDESWDRMMAVHLKGTFLTCKSVVPHMIKRKRGKIINIASMGGKMGFPLAGVHYCAAKGGIMAFTRQLALQLGPYNIQVNSIAPGTTATEMIIHRDPEQLKNIVEEIPLKRLGMPEDTAFAVLFLASSWADYITGETIDVNGGKYMQ